MSAACATSTRLLFGFRVKGVCAYTQDVKQPAQLLQGYISEFRVKGGCAHTQDVSSLRDFYEVNLELARPGAPISFYEVEEGVVSTGQVLPPALIHGCDVEHCLVGEGSVLKVGFRV